MIKQFITSKGLLALAGIVLLWLLITWVSQGDENDADSQGESRLQQKKDDGMVSSIQPIAGDDVSQSDAVPPSILTVAGPAAPMLDDAQNKRLHALFKQAVANQQAGDTQSAIDQYQALISQYPGIPESYINLANLLGAQGDLEQALSVLTQGVQANRKAALLVQGLKNVHGALAAQAYRRALDVSAPEQASSPVALPVIFELQTQLDAQDQIKRLEASLSEQSQSMEGSNQLASEYLQRLTSLEQQLAAQKQNTDNTVSNQADQISGLQQQLTQANELLVQSQQAEREALARVVRAEQDAKSQVENAEQELAVIRSQLSDQETSLTTQITQQEARLKAEIDRQQLALSNAEQEKQTLLATLQSEQRKVQALTQENSQLAANAGANVAAALPVDTAASTAANTEATTSTSASELSQPSGQDSTADRSEEQEQQAIRRVQSWAQAWSDQNVSAYVSHYANDYSSSPAITRDQWLQQRLVRLTNKQFINVQVSLFKVEDLGRRFAVTFRQHYKSDVIDDVIFKRLVFEKVGSDWSAGKIVTERVVSPS